MTNQLKRDIYVKSTAKPLTFYFNYTFIIGILILMFVFSALPGTAGASSTFYAITPARGSELLVEFNLDSITNEIIEVTNSVALTLDGEAPEFFTNSIAFSPTGELYGWSSSSINGYEGMGRLYTIDTSTGEIDLIGVPQGEPRIYGMAFDTDGTLYGLAEQHLYSINTSTGENTQIGTELIGSIYGGLGFDYSTGELYAWTGRKAVQDQLLNINKTTGEVTDIEINFDVEYDSVGAEFNPDNGEMLAIRRGNMLYSTDITTGEGVYLGMVTLDGTPIYSRSLATFAVVPEPVSSALFIIGGATLGFRRFRKRAKAK